MRALKFITGRVIYNPAYTYKFQLKTTNDTIQKENSTSERLFTPICRGSISELSRRGGAWGIKSSFKSSESGEVDVLLQNYREKKIIEKIL